jgi:hypothetical protein
MSEQKMALAPAGPSWSMQGTPECVAQKKETGAMLEASNESCGFRVATYELAWRT